MSKPLYVDFTTSLSDRTYCGVQGLPLQSFAEIQAQLEADHFLLDEFGFVPKYDLVLADKIPNRDGFTLFHFKIVLLEKV